jgi:Carboxypeptidase regulatory-like domain/TonB-dependent Receptor Plug Domain
MSRRAIMFRPSALALAIAMACSGAVLAQSSEGSLYGRAKGGATVSIVAIDTGTKREIKADADGSFNFSKLPPGRYRVTSDGVTREVNVAIGSGSEVVLEGDAQRIEISGSRIRSGIDVTSVESNTVFTQEQIRTLPVARSIDAVALLAPGTVKGDNFGRDLTLPSFAGASVAENGYYINGLDVTNIRTFLSYADLPFDGIAQQQIKSGGYGAEYGRSLGGVVSIVTKRGTNEWKSGAAFYWEPKALRSKGSDVADKEPERAGLPFVFNSADKVDLKSYVLYAGGPIIKDRLFAFGMVEAVDNERSVFNQSASEKRRRTNPNGLLKVDWSITDSHLAEFTAITSKRKYKYTDYNNTTPYATSHEGTGGESTSDEGGNVYIAKYTGYLTDDLTVSALVGRVNDKREKFSGARQEGLDCPVVLDLDTSEIGCWAGPFPGVGAPDPAAPRDEDKRKSFRIDAEYSLGKHRLKAGVDNQTFTSSEAGGSSYTGGAYYRYFLVGANGQVNGVSGFTPGSQYVRKRILQSTSGAYEVKNSAMYIEDAWNVTKDFLLYGGLRWESFENKNSDGVAFVKKDKLMAPRLGFSWDVNGDASMKIYGNAGRYYIPVASNTNIRGTRAELFVQQYYQFASRDPRTQGPVGLGAEIGRPQVVSDGTLPDPGTIADTELKPMNQDEFILGIQKAITKQFNIGLKGTYRKINAGMDDYCDHTRVAAWITANVNSNYSDNLASCMLMNPGEDLNIKVDLADDGNLVPVRIPASALGLAKYERTYKSLEFTVERPFDGKWGLQGSYTWSKSIGTAEGYVQSNLNQEDAGVTQDFDFGSFTDGAKGYLPNDRKHVIKAFGRYQLTDEWRVGGNVTISSGRPISCIGFVPPTVSDFAGSGQYSSASAYYCIKDPNKPAELVSRGTVGRTPWTSTFDLGIAYEPLWARKKLTLGVDIFNLFNSQKATEVNEVRDYSRGESNATVFPLRQGANYLSPTGFQAPRSVRLTARYEF